MIGVKVAIMSPTARIYDRIDISDEIKNRVRGPEKTEEKTKTKKTGKKSSSSFSEEKMETKNLDIKDEEDGTAMQIEEEIEEGVPQEQIEKDLKENTNKPKKPVKEEKE